MKLPFLILALFLWAQAAHADNITTLSADTSPTTDDLIYSLNDPSGSPGDRKVTIGNLAKPVINDKNQPSIGFIIDGGGSAITTGTKQWVQVPYACTISKATATADTTGSIQIELWKDTYANFPPTSLDKISASAPVTLSSAQKSVDTALTGWTTTVTAGDFITPKVNSATGVTKVLVQLECDI